MTDRAAVAWCEENMAGLEVSHHGLAGHHSPEDRPGELAAAISSWADRHGLARPGRRVRHRPTAPCATPAIHRHT
ncbi:haloalkane dehalogenase [Streptomyces lavendulae subsp. lavendulae]|uniref:Haloalkane dehalogenase n=1 Tax=Streptomyces lavendulae subsp. lavendulae TaxID=58340 RepID=A0A2K8PA76_STRLA|nr:haloalkane dehalogenase [Streptomyces lavendulae subsp. lavendulae]